MKKRWLIIIISIGLIILGVTSYFIFGRKQTSIYTTVNVTRGNIVQTVNETGTVKSGSELNLSFLNSGKINRIYFDVGATVTKDMILSELDTSGLNINKKDAQANLDVARSNLNKIRSGATAQDIALARANLEQAKKSDESAVNELDKVKKTVAENIAQAEKTLNDLKQDSTAEITAVPITTYQKSINDNKQNALNTIDNKLIVADTALDTIDRTINDADAKDLISVKNPIFLANTKADYDLSLKYLGNAQKSLAQAKSSKTDTDLENSLDEALLALNETFLALQDCFSALENSITSVTKLTQTQLDTFKTNISAQQTLIATAISAVESAKQTYNNSVLAFKNALDSAGKAYSLTKITGEQQIAVAESKAIAASEAVNISQAQYNKTIAPADKNDIALAEARIRQAQAALDSVSKQIENSQIKSPINGTVIKVNFKEGEQVITGTDVISMLGENNFEIEVLISEADIAKVVDGDKAVITLDAFGDDAKFNGQVVFIEPAETVVQGVIYYKVKAYFDIADRAVKSGMTANVIITTGEGNDVLVIPARAIVEKNGQGKIVRVLINGRLDERPVTTGLSGDEGMIEVLSGLKENEAVITYIK